MPARRPSLLVAPLLGAVVLACSDQPSPVAPPAGALRTETLEMPQANGIPVYGLGGLRRATPQSPCAVGRSRQFDLWLGNWVVLSPPNSPLAGAPGAKSRISLDLDGCAVMEAWTPRPTDFNPFAFRGRSINAYDAETDTWHQTWVTEGSFPRGGFPFRMTGRLREDGAMAMEGTRLFWANNEPWIDRVQWTKVDDDHVNQAWVFERPWFNVRSSGVVPYTRVAELPDFPLPAPATNCLAGNVSGETRALDFTIGRWAVRAANGLELGESEITVDPTLSGCLLEERFANGKGYRAIGWMYYDPIENRYYRTYVDSEGEWAELRGAPVVNPLVLEGAEPVPGASDARLRMTWTTLTADRLEQRWEVSTDAGASWREAETLTFERR